MKNKRFYEETENIVIPNWEFEFMSGLNNIDEDKLYRIRVEDEEKLCEKCREMDSKVFMIKSAVVGENYPPFHPNCRCKAVDKNAKILSIWEEEFCKSMLETYNFSFEQSNLILTAYRLLLKQAEKDGLTGEKKIHYISSSIAALCNDYSGDKISFLVSADNPTIEEAKKHLIWLGMSAEDVYELCDFLEIQHNKMDKKDGKYKDFAHEMAEYSVFSNDSLPHNMIDGFIGDLGALASYKGDVFSAIMPKEDMNCDIDATNTYQRMLLQEKGFFETIVEYNDGVRNGKINRFDEFLEFYGDGDARKGLQYIKDDLDTVDIGSHYLSATFKDKNFKSFLWENIQDMMLEASVFGSGIDISDEKTINNLFKITNAYKSFQESEDMKNDPNNNYNESINDIKKKFVKYLEDGMSK